MSGGLDVRDTYYYALRNGQADVTPGHVVAGVVRSPAYGITEYVDENYPELAPPRRLLNRLKLEATHPDLEDYNDEESHNRAWDRIGFGEEYREYLSESEEAQARIAEIREWAAEWPVWLVCFENTDKKRCHRTILREVIVGGDA